MTLTREQRTLKSSLDGIIDRATFKYATRVNLEADKPAATKQAFWGSGHLLEVSRIASEVIEEMLPEAFQAYNAERSRLWFNRSQLNYLLRDAVNAYYDHCKRQMPSPKDWMLKLDYDVSHVSLQERRKLTLARVEEHCRHPGVLPPLQRHPIAALVITNIATALLTILGRMLVK